MVSHCDACWGVSSHFLPRGVASSQRAPVAALSSLSHSLTRGGGGGGGGAAALPLIAALSSGFASHRRLRFSGLADDAGSSALVAASRATSEWLGASFVWLREAVAAYTAADASPSSDASPDAEAALGGGPASAAGGYALLKEDKDNEDDGATAGPLPGGPSECITCLDDDIGDEERGFKVCSSCFKLVDHGDLLDNQFDSSVLGFSVPLTRKDCCPHRGMPVPRCENLPNDRGYRLAPGIPRDRSPNSD